MHRTISWHGLAPLAAVIATLLLAAGCGDVEVSAKDNDKKADKAPSASPSSAAVDTAAGEGDWLLGITSAGGNDAETSTTTYIVFNPSTGQATAHKMPGVQAGDTSAEQASLLVSANRRYAIPDTGINRTEQRSGRLKVYSLSGGATKAIDVRERTGQDDVRPVAWAFDPTREDTLRVVDTKNRVWSFSVAGGKATEEPSLPTGDWVFTNGFNANTGEPYVESIDSDETKPAGNGEEDSYPISRDKGTVLPAMSPAFSKLPASPCHLGAGFTTEAGVTWAFCADDPTIAAYYLPKGGTKWTSYGKPSASVAPEADAFPLVLPPAE
jgi:hypothetical protein